ncbi:MAG: heme peroxidase family protein [Solirubrobacteraceae bacterium]|nr:heme peroxidase family protein [Solirubrobacteraceae bacterium]
MLRMKHGGHAPEPAPNETPFDYLLPDLPGDPGSLIPGDPATVVAGLKALGSAMVDDAAPDGAQVNSTIPAIYTYWGQFIDHDMTATMDSPAIGDITSETLRPADPSLIAAKLKNERRPTFDLDSVYGNGPGLDADCYRPDPGSADTAMYDGIRMRVGANADEPDIPGARIPPVDDLSRDLPRVGPLLQAGAIAPDELPEDLRDTSTQALIGDARNDENLIVAQLHLAFLRFHNRVVDAIEADPATYGLAADSGDAERFAEAQRLVRYHYQWLVVHDYLKTVALPGIVDSILLGGAKHYEPLADGELHAPLEYAVAAYRFGHSMVRGAYDHNRNFGTAVAPDESLEPVASFEDLFLFTGNGHELDPDDITKSTRNPFRGASALPFNWIVEWDRMSSKVDPDASHFARKIDARLVPPIHNMVNEGTDEGELQSDASTAVRELLRSLTQRNLLRGYLLSIPTGQAVAAAIGVDALSDDELRAGNTDAVNAALDAGGFVEHTPLWYYVLKEAETRANGNALGELGSRIVVETQVGIMQHDPASFLNAGWDPSQGVKLSNGDPIVTIRDFLAFADLPV